ncbi:hypothetical protein B0J11DRAFT_578782 [Dendryphion nanum]|uniref:Uncharacterized protein n=1 Tax=Dendryphion nanum TaxID=256645 RepID=A0A9P9E0W9_9PLEO|nr:hypothetical protein B0J11DRAFT_578782 [Dendryphion nanum]
MSVSRSFLHVSLLFFLSLLSLYFFVGIWLTEWVSESQPQKQDAFFGILSPVTVNAINEDIRLNHAIISLTETIVQASTNLGEQYDSDHLRDFAMTLNEQLKHIRNVKTAKRRKRGFLEDISGIFGGGVSKNASSPQSVAGGLFSGIGDALGLGGNGTGGIGGLFASLGTSIVGGLAEPALFLGIGLGMGAETGLNLTDMQQARILASSVASAYNATPTGINMVAQNLGSGLSAQIAPTLGNVTTGTNLGMAAFALAQGIGQGSSNGLKLTQQQFLPSNGTDIMAIAANLGLGIATPIASSIDIQKLVGQAAANGGRFTQQLPQIAAAAGKGLGEGASSGLGLAKSGGNPSLQRRQAAEDPNQQADIPGAVGDFTRGLSQSFLQSSDLTKVANMIAPGTSGGINFDIIGMIGPLAAGAGKGIGQGAAIGLGFKTDAGVTTIDPNSNQSTMLVTEAFAKNLVASFLANGTANAALSNLTSNASGLTASIQPAKVAEGLARGLVEGSVNAISRAGGIQNVLSGNFSLEGEFPEMAPTSFNDSVNGSAVAFGRGLSGEGTLLIASLIANATKPAPQKRIPHGALNGRQASGGDERQTSALAVSGDMLSSILQAGTDALTCQGFGGIAAVGLGLVNSGTIKIDTKNAVPLDNQTLAALPKDPITIVSEGNRFEIKIQSTEVTINGQKIVPFAVFTALHVLLTSIAFLFALPAYLALGAILRLSSLMGHPVNTAKNTKWRFGVFVYLFVPTALLGTVFGIVAMGNAAHFRSGHSIFGLIAFLFLVPTTIFTILRLRCTEAVPSAVFSGVKGIPTMYKSPARPILISATLVQITLQFGTIAWTTGFSELRSISLCVVDAILTAPTIVGALTLLLFLQIAANALVGLRGWIEQRIAKQERLLSSGDEAGDMKRSNTMATFGFDPAARNFSPAPSDASSTRPVLAQRTTTELLGREDSTIGWPRDVRKVGEEDSVPMKRTTQDLFSPTEENSRQNMSGRRLTYNEKLGGYEKDKNRVSVQEIDGPGPVLAVGRPDSEIEPNPLYPKNPYGFYGDVRGDDGSRVSHKLQQLMLPLLASLSSLLLM